MKLSKKQLQKARAIVPDVICDNVSTEPTRFMFDGRQVTMAIEFEMDSVWWKHLVIDLDGERVAVEGLTELEEHVLFSSVDEFCAMQADDFKEVVFKLIAQHLQSKQGVH